jgi:hypothetical protein
MEKITATDVSQNERKNENRTIENDKYFISLSIFPPVYPFFCLVLVPVGLSIYTYDCPTVCPLLI